MGHVGRVLSARYPACFGSGMSTPLMLVRREYIDLLRVTSAACTGGRPLG
ncbi:conserved hypothetical protein [Frankia sp. Hr75.2]|nr:conserved hypothetical protein [Frankia sp. Hr75.2]